MARVTLKCEQCGEAFERYPSQLRRPGQGKYCSVRCRREGVKRGGSTSCTRCGREFYKQRAESDSATDYCSSLCYQQHRDENRGDTYPRIGSKHEHRIVAEAALGRALRPGEVVHHMDENKTNNRTENLAVFPSQSLHAKWHAGAMAEETMLGYALKNGAPSLG